MSLQLRLFFIFNTSLQEISNSLQYPYLNNNHPPFNKQGYLPPLKMIKARSFDRAFSKGMAAEMRHFKGWPRYIPCQSEKKSGFISTVNPSVFINRSAKP